MTLTLTELDVSFNEMTGIEYNFEDYTNVQ